jgi:hypothetical protein
MSATEPRYCPISTLHRTLRQGTGSKGRARATVTRRLRTIAGFYKYTVEEELLEHSPAALDRSALLVAAGLPTAHAPASWKTSTPPRAYSSPRPGSPKTVLPSPPATAASKSWNASTSAQHAAISGRSRGTRSRRSGLVLARDDGVYDSSRSGDRCTSARPPALSCRYVRALGRLVSGVCAMTFAVVARLTCDTLSAGMPAGQ